MTEKMKFDNYLRYDSFFYLISITLLLTFSNCSDNFEPLQENERHHFSMYGFLDASADTQWVRITPIREQTESATQIPEMSVILEDLQTGKQIEMKDSLFQRSGVNFLNFWTTEPIQHNQTYRLSAENSSGKKSTTVVNTPNELPTPLVVIQQFFGQPTTYQVVVSDQVNIADVQSKWYIRINTPNSSIRRIVSFAYRNSFETSEAFGGAFTYLLEPAKELEEIERQVLLPSDGEIEVVHRQIFVASTSSEWPDSISTLDDITYALPEVFSNIENGTGFLTGIDSKYVPYASCENEEKTQIIPCPEEEKFWR